MHFEGRLCQQNSRIPGPPFSFEHTSFSSLKLCRAMQFIIFLCRFQVWNCVGRCNLMKFHAFLCRFQVWNCIDRCNVSHAYAISKCETLSFDVIWNKIILPWVHALFRDPLRSGRGNFTEIKFNQIRSRCDEFGDFFSENRTFWGVSKLRFSSYFQILLKVVLFVEFGLMIAHFCTYFLNFLKV